MKAFSEARAASAELAATFRGLPPGYSRFQLCDDLKIAREDLGIDSDSIWLLEFYIKRTKDQDWVAGAEPIAAWPRFEISSITGWSDDKIARIEERLCAARLLAFKMGSASCKRRAYRGEDGFMMEGATGVSLAPVGARAAEIRALHHERILQIAKKREALGEVFRLRADLHHYGELKTLPDSARERILELLDRMPRRRDARIEMKLIRELIERARCMIKSIRAMVGLCDRPTEQSEAAGGQRGSLPAVGEPQADNCGVSADAAQSREYMGGRSSSAILDIKRSMFRIGAVHKQPESIIPKEDHEFLLLLRAAPDLFKAYIEQAQSQSNRPDEVLRTATERYALGLCLSTSYVGKLVKSFGFTRTLRALFDLARMLEKGSRINNPAGYALSLVRRSGGALRSSSRIGRTA
ncbi:hypothetical protein D2T29_12765 [Sinirhodobacter populi]|uniref:Plasmid replication protein C N-terminal domain-containing protein n=1 Tax=Paenirhodobacter populi TaxID=2306993 RepID=A0A443KCK1_9RHOB|nr:helix-turn-helix domain-containing protein [Sinirhodobacter populi]RWR30537.1 hypothetical protein D2T29_12765 [Sinirhodobacter populi]